MPELAPSPHRRTGGVNSHPAVARLRHPLHELGVARLTLSPRRLDTPSYTTQVSTLKFGWKNHSYRPPRNTTAIATTWDSRSSAYLQHRAYPPH
ncbi:unnamed protein product [Mesocestoides corti]|uniref:Uncharacterized protein n=1 Tax=Mesocestoides corti TaxID=53468 RepID=A0A0R3UDT7_MESCO|nr:unnamed protein product [Mesocestoides corti]